MSEALQPTMGAAMNAPRRFTFGPIWFCLPGAIFLLFFFLMPMVQVISLSVLDPLGAIDFASFNRLFESAVYQQVMIRTFVVAFEVTMWCLLLGYPVAYWLSTKEARRQRMLLLLVLLPFWASALVKNFAWLVLLGRNGLVGEVLTFIGIPGGDSLLFTRTTVIFGMVHTLLPLTVIALMPVLNQINRSLTMAASTLGASGANVFWRIFFPLSMRGVATSGLLIFVVSLGFFITPALIGGPRQTMIGQMIITHINQMQNWQFGSALAVVLIAAALVTIFLFDRIFGLSSVAGGGGNRPADSWLRLLGLKICAVLGAVFSVVGSAYQRTMRGVPGRSLLGLYCWLVIAILLLPIVGVIPMAFTSGEFMEFPPPGFSTRWFEVFFESPLWMSATVRSFAVGFATAAMTLIISTLVAFGIARSQGRLSAIGFTMFMAPMVVPHLVISIALFYLFAQLGLVATNLGIVIGHTVVAMPIVFVILLATFKGHDWRLDQAAATLGAGRVQIARRITLPLIRTGLIVGFITGFLQSFEELTIVMFIGGGLITTLPKQMWDEVILQVNPALAAASVVVLVTVTVLFLLMELFQTKRR